MVIPKYAAPDYNPSKLKLFYAETILIFEYLSIYSSNTKDVM